MDLHLKDRVALVTAGSLGLGFATALQLSREGALVALCSRNEAHVNAATDAIEAETGGAVLGIRADITNPEDIQGLFESVTGEYGGLDILITNAGNPPGGSFENLTDAMWVEAFEQNLLSAVRLIRAALPHLRQSTTPSVLTIASFSALHPVPTLMLSTSIRLAVIGMTKTLALELGSQGIRFNSILPGWTETVRVQDLIEARAARNGTAVEEEIARQASSSALGRLATPEEFANVATFLCSPAASYITGVALPVDGGIYKATL